MRRSLAVLAALVMLVLVFAPVAASGANHKPTHHRPRHGTTTTTVPPTTVTTAPPTTTTTVPPPTTTTTTPPTCGGPITVTTATVLTGCYRSTDPAMPAIRVQTTGVVELNHARVEHAGHGVFMQWNGARINAHDSVFQKLAAPAGGPGRAIYAWGAVQLNVDYNRFTNGDGVHWNEGNGIALGGSFTHNEVTNVGRYQPSELVQAFQQALTYSPNVEVAWNKITNTFGQSDVEDVLNWYRGGGVAGSRVRVHHNLVDGAYPTVAGFTGTCCPNYFGGGINTGDGNNGDPVGTPESSFIDTYDNWVVSTSNYGIAISGGTDHDMHHNVAVNDACAVNQTPCPAGMITGPWFGAGLIVWDNPDNVNNVAHDNTLGWSRPTSATTTEREDRWMPSCAAPFDVYDAADDVACPNNVSLPGPIDSVTEQGARNQWEAARTAAGVTVGPRP